MFYKIYRHRKKEYESTLTNDEIISLYIQDEIGKQLYEKLTSKFEPDDLWAIVLSVVGKYVDAKRALLNQIETYDLNFLEVIDAADEIAEDYYTLFGLKLAKVVERLPKYDDCTQGEIKEDMKEIIEELKSEGEDMGLVEKYFDVYFEKYCDIHEIIKYIKLMNFSWYKLFSK